MANRAVFLDRDGTVMQDPGYQSGPEAVSLLPGVELAIKSLIQAGFKIVLVSNQPGVAFGRCSEQAVRATHEELRRQLEGKGARVDAIYYCPHHPDGSADAYARECEDRKPRPGMLTSAARDLGLDLARSWMIGDSARDIEAGQRAGCRTIRLRSAGDTAHGEDAAVDEDVQADFTVRNLIDAARVVIREFERNLSAGPTAPASDAPVAAAAPASPAAAAPDAPPPPPRPINTLSDSEALHELLKIARQLMRSRAHGGFSAMRLISGVLQGLAALAGVWGLVKLAGMGAPTANLDAFYQTIVWIALAILAQLGALTFLIMARSED